MITACLGPFAADLGDPARRMLFSSGELFARRNSKIDSLSVGFMLLEAFLDVAVLERAAGLFCFSPAAA